MILKQIFLHLGLFFKEEVGHWTDNSVKMVMSAVFRALKSMWYSIRACWMCDCCQRPLWKYFPDSLWLKEKLWAIGAEIKNRLFSARANKLAINLMRGRFGANIFSLRTVGRCSVVAAPLDSDQRWFPWRPLHWTDVVAVNRPDFLLLLGGVCVCLNRSHTSMHECVKNVSVFVFLSDGEMQHWTV